MSFKKKKKRMKNASFLFIGYIEILFALRQPLQDFQAVAYPGPSRLQAFSPCVEILIHKFTMSSRTIPWVTNESLFCDTELHKWYSFLFSFFYDSTLFINHLQGKVTLKCYLLLTVLNVMSET